MTRCPESNKKTEKGSLVGFLLVLHSLVQSSLIVCQYSNEEEQVSRELFVFYYSYFFNACDVCQVSCVCVCVFVCVSVNVSVYGCVCVCVCSQELKPEQYKGTPCGANRMHVSLAPGSPPPSPRPLLL